MAHNNKPPTMRDVAQLAGVSVQTVSLVVNDKSTVTDATRQRVLTAIEELGYRPYMVARGLRTRQTRTIGLILPDIANPFFATIAGTAEDYAYRFGYSLILYNTHDDTTRENKLVQTAVQSWVDGMLIVATDDLLSNLDQVKRSGIPVVPLERVSKDHDGPHVLLDNLQVGRMATDYLLDLGHTDIACIHGPLELQLSRDRLDGYQQALHARGLEPGLIANGNGSWNYDDGFNATQQILQHAPCPTAIVAANDRMAIGAIRALYEAGLRVPDDVSVIGVDDVQIAPYSIPALTTIRQPYDEIGTLGIQLLLEMIEHRLREQSQITIQPSLIIRESTRHH